MHCKAGNMNVSTYGAVQCVKYHLKSRSMDAGTYFRKFNPVLSRNIRSSSRRYRDALRRKNEEAKLKELKLALKAKHKLQSKASFSKKNALEVKAAQAQHIMKLQRESQKRLAAVKTLQLHQQQKAIKKRKPLNEKI